MLHTKRADIFFINKTSVSVPSLSFIKHLFGFHQENPQGGGKREENKGEDPTEPSGASDPDQRRTAAASELAHSRSQHSGSPLSNRDMDSDISDDIDQELDIEEDDDVQFRLNSQIWDFIVD